MTPRLGRRGFVGGAAALSAGLWLPRPGRAATAMGFDEARHLLSRTTFGATPAEIRALESQDYAGAVDRLLGSVRRDGADAGTGVGQRGAGRAAPPAAGRGGRRQDRRRRQEAAGRAAGPGRRPRAAQLVGRGDAGRPTSRSSSAWCCSGTTISPRRSRRCATRRRCSARTRCSAARRSATSRTLLKAVARDPAMLIYLDGMRSRGAPAQREFRPRAARALHPGRGPLQRGRHQGSGARLHRLDRSTAKPVRSAAATSEHDDGEKTFLGQTGRFDGDEIIAILLQPSAHRRDDRREAVARVRLAAARSGRGEAARGDRSRRRLRDQAADARDVPVAGRSAIPPIAAR